MDYLHIPAETLGDGAKLPLVKLGENGEVFYELALELIRVIEDCRAANQPAVCILPVGPVGQYPIFVRLVNERGISLQHCWFINMDEYLDERGGWVAPEHPLSFRRSMQREVYEKLAPALLMPESQRIFPDPRDPGAIPRLIGELGGVDLCIGGVGMNGHLAFNEPQPDLPVDAFAQLPTRVLDIAPETRAINAAFGFGGALHAMPTRCVTVGMREILGAKKLRLGCFRDWHRAVVRQAAYGEVSAAFPVTLAQRHPDAKLYCTKLVAELPY